MGLPKDLIRSYITRRNDKHNHIYVEVIPELADLQSPDRHALIKRGLKRTRFNRAVWMLTIALEDMPIAFVIGVSRQCQSECGGDKALACLTFLACW